MIYTCPVCREPFKAAPSAKRIVCSRVCSGRRRAKYLRGIAPVAANRARYERVRARHRQMLQRQFGELSVREIALLRMVYWKAYNLGYQRALKRQPRKVAA